MSIHALLLSDEPLTVSAGRRRLVSAGFVVQNETNPAVALRRLRGGALGLFVVDLDLEAGVDRALAEALTQAALSTPTVLVAVSALQDSTHDWPHSAGKPFSVEQARVWRARATERLGIATPTPVSVDRLAENLGGNLEDVLETLRDYESMAVPHHDALRRAIAAEDWPAVAEIAHRVCGALGAIEACEAATTCRQLMNAASARDAAGASHLAASVVAQLICVEQSVARHIGRAQAVHHHAAVG